MKNTVLWVVTFLCALACCLYEAPARAQFQFTIDQVCQQPVIGHDHPEIAGSRSKFEGGAAVKLGEFKVFRCDSEETDAEWSPGSQAVDGNPDTIWHTQWKKAQPGFPHELLLELDSVRELVGLAYLPRQDRPTSRPKGIVVETSLNGKDWTTACTGTAEDSGKWQQFKFATLTRVKLLRLRITSSQDGKPDIAIAEVVPLAAKPLVAEAENTSRTLAECGKEPGATVVGSKDLGVLAVIRPDGTIAAMQTHFRGGWHDIDFHRGPYAGPALRNVVLRQETPGKPVYVGRKDGVAYRLAYETAPRKLSLLATVYNDSEKVFSPDSVSLVLGIDTYMDRFPRWNMQFFPTFLRCEPTHFWAYFMTPKGRILGISSPDPVGSYTINYLMEMYGHYVHTVTLDLMQKPPVPDFHPHYRPLTPGERRMWRIDLQPIDDHEAIPAVLAEATHSPMIELARYSLEPDQPAEIVVHSSEPVSAVVTDPAGMATNFDFAPTGPKLQAAFFRKTSMRGRYLVSVENRSGKKSEASFYVHPPWSWYLQKARVESLRLTPRADLSDGVNGYSCETHYGLFAFFLARRYFPDAALDTSGDRILDQVMAKLYTEKDGQIFSGNRERIQNGSTMASIHIDRYRATNDIASLETAVKFADYLLARQHEKGYYGGYGMRPYTSVIYPAKSLMELMAVEHELGHTNPKWQNLYQRHYESVRRAMDELLARGLDVATEGGGTFEDGSVSCSASQLGMFALLQTDPAARAKYLDGARMFLEAHRCLARLHDPDGRSHGATLRFWEAWGDIQTPAQMMLSPHGWSAWRLYALHYLYLLTGEEKYLRQTIDAMGAATQLIQWPSGEMCCAFVPDPRLQVPLRVPDPKQPEGCLQPTWIGQQYLRGIGAWYGKRTAGDSAMDRVQWMWCGDGITCEIFKAMEEIVLTHAYVLERKDGSLLTWNCSSRQDQRGHLILVPAEDVVVRIHLNLQRPHEVRASFALGKTVSRVYQPGLHWIGPGGTPEDLR